MTVASMMLMGYRGGEMDGGTRAEQGEAGMRGGRKGDVGMCLAWERVGWADMATWFL
jgi:hypothetical protein